MIISSVALAGALGVGTLGASVKVYREEKRKKEYPWTYAAERMARKKKGPLWEPWAGESLFLPSRRKKPPLLLDKLNRRISNLSARTKAPFDKLRASLTTVKKQIIKPFAQDTRREQLQAFSSSDETGISFETERINRYMTIGATAMGFSMAGYFIPPLTFIAAIPACYAFISVVPAQKCW